MYLGQLVNDGQDLAVADLLQRTMRVPADNDTAKAAMDELEEFTARIRERGSAAAVGRVASLLSWFWWIESPELWPVLWNSGEKTLKRCGFLESGGTQWDRYVEYREHVRRFGHFAEVEQVLGLTHDRATYGVDISAADRLALVPNATGSSADPEEFVFNKESLTLLRLSLIHI